MSKKNITLEIKSLDILLEIRNWILEIFMKIFVFGNPDVEIDSLPLRILPGLRSHFPDIEFIVLDPNEEWKIPDEMVMIDTVVGIKELTVFSDLKRFIKAPRVSVHDFDAFFNLIYLQKLGKLKKIKIFGLPPDMTETTAEEVLTNAIKKWSTRIRE